MSNRLQGKVTPVTAVGQGTACARFRWHFSTGNPRRGLSRSCDHAHVVRENFSADQSDHRRRRLLRASCKRPGCRTAD
jgi:hypothetical protein